ncbi:cation:proton antiporter [Sinorhizobium sp. RAC02]|uniref:cation:proton antiporter n=1 Tax=Sinorhizobium sp. RAC02 TaxID=1842534 RepID=UPI00083E2EF2|nr:cation:proton antiporter [Sinorhizobium sp. RAC02]AOF91648.1 multiple resistance and pH regulation F family protein [Sinorhizobium sp. RAC02]
MGAETIVSTAANIALLLMCAAFFLTAYRVIKGPTLPDRIVALDMLTGIAIGFIAVVAIKTGFNLYIDIAIALGLVGFLATVAFARFVLTQGMQVGEDNAPETDLPRKGARHFKQRNKGRAR